MRINFNVSFPALSCEFASVDVGDAMGLNRYNLTKTVFKRPIDKDFNPTGPIQWERGAVKEVEHADDEAHAAATAAVEQHAAAMVANPDDDHPEPVIALDDKNFESVKKSATVLLVNFYAPWCPWSRRLEPVWEAAAIEVHKKYPKHIANRVVIAKVDCTLHEIVCRNNHIQGYPSIRIFTKGSDVIDHGRHHDHASYHGDRTVEAIVKFADTMLPEATAVEAAQAPVAVSAPVGDAVKSVNGPGCSITGFVLVKKVPGHLWWGAAR
jgi:thiol-disulfide isomerase/thioredoxin